MEQRNACKNIYDSRSRCDYHPSMGYSDHLRYVRTVVACTLLCVSPVDRCGTAFPMCSMHSHANDRCGTAFPMYSRDNRNLHGYGNVGGNSCHGLLVALCRLVVLLFSRHNTTMICHDLYNMRSHFGSPFSHLGSSPLSGLKSGKLLLQHALTAFGCHGVVEQIVVS